MKNILVTGGKGQLASSIKGIGNKFKEYNFIFIDIDELNITNNIDIEAFFNQHKITHCINCAAYTAVDLAESNKKLAESVNVDGSKNLAFACHNNNAVLIHISTDFVFDGKQTKPYCEEDEERPLGVYGKTKLLGEKEIAIILKEHFIIRTSWLYSEHGQNFLKTMMKLGIERNELSVVVDQIGTPTYAEDLAKLVIDLIKLDNKSYGIYHFSNEGVASWYDFAKAIFDESKIEVKLFPIKSEAYPTPAERPKFSVMDKSKIKKEFNLEIPYWRDSMRRCLTNLQKMENNN